MAYNIQREKNVRNSAKYLLCYLIAFLPLFSNCYYWTISSHEGIFMRYDKAQYSRVGERTYDFFIAKPRVSNLVKAQNRDSVRLFLNDPKNWERQKKFNWLINAYRENEPAVVDHRKYKLSILDTSVLEIQDVSHIEFKKSGLGQIKFLIKKNGITQLIAKKESEELKMEVQVKDSIVSPHNSQIKMWNETIIGPIWF